MHKAVSIILASASEILYKSEEVLKIRVQFLQNLLGPIISCLSHDLNVRPPTILNRMILRAPKLLTIKECRLKATLSAFSLELDAISTPEESTNHDVDRALSLIRVPLGFTTLSDYSQFFFKHPRLLVLPLSVLARPLFFAMFSSSLYRDDRILSNAYIYQICSSVGFQKINFTVSEDDTAEFLSCNTNEFVEFLNRYISIEYLDLDSLYSSFLREIEEYILYGTFQQVDFEDVEKYPLQTLSPAYRGQMRSSEYQERQLCGTLNKIFDF